MEPNPQKIAEPVLPAKVSKKRPMPPEYIRNSEMTNSKRLRLNDVALNEPEKNLCEQLVLLLRLNDSGEERKENAGRDPFSIIGSKIVKAINFKLKDNANPVN